MALSGISSKKVTAKQREMDLRNMFSDTWYDNTQKNDRNDNVLNACRIRGTM
jgi:hypothetical protein